MKAKHTVRYMSMMRWQDIANGVCVTWETRVRVQLQRIGILFSAHARLWRTLERLENQRVASLEFQCRDSWVIENIFIGAKARKDYELVVHWMVDNGTTRTICIDLSNLGDMC